jgi:transcriptional regulator with XRE-family HTH domain
MNISERIKSLRTSKHYSQDYMALQIGISQRAYSKIENNEVKLDLDKLFKIAEIFEMDPGELISDQNSQTNNFSNNKLITNAVVNNYSKMHDELQKNIIEFLKDELSILRLQIAEKDKHILELIKSIN